MLRALDYLEPLPVHEPGEPLAGVLQPLCSGTPIAVIDDAGWRLVRPTDALPFPLSRQLCDVPGERLATLAVDEALELDRLAEHEVWGAIKNDELVGRVESLRVRASIAELPGPESEAALAVALRERLLPRLLHDLSNALNIVAAVYPGRSDPMLERAGAEAIEHAGSLLLHMRELYTRVVGGAGDTLELTGFLAATGPMLRVAAAPASLEIRCGVEPLEVRAERWRLESAVLNAVLNASEVARAIVVETLIARDGQVVIAISDDGPGFAELDAQDPWSIRGHGLPSIRRQLHAMGGALVLGRSSDGGARVELRLTRV